ncbi:MAG: ATP-dependent DNA helicase [Nitrospiria bacterium]
MPYGDLSKALSRYDDRPSQFKMAQAVEDALNRNKNLVVEAATGTGKTWAYLIPAIFKRRKVIVSTGTKTLQDQLFFKDLPFLAKTLHEDFTFCMMKGKSNYLCLHRFGQAFQQSALWDEAGRGHLEVIRQWATQTKSGDRAEISGMPESSPQWQEVSVKGEACLGGQCPDFERCYLTRIRQEAAASDIVVVNHYLFFADLALKHVGYGEILPHYHAVVFDEAHLLEEVATQYFGVSVSSYKVEDFIRDAEREFRFRKEKDHPCLVLCGKILIYSEKFFDLFKNQRERYRLTDQDFTPDRLHAGLELLQAFKHLGRAISTLRMKSDDLSQLSERLETLQVDLQTFLEKKDRLESFVYWAERRKNTMQLHASPLNVSGILKERLFQGDKAVIMTSATLSAEGAFDFMRGRLGIDDADEAIFETAFDFERQALIYLPGHLPSPSDEDFTSAVSDEIVRILKESQGRAFLLFTSWRNLEAVYKRVSNRLPYRLLKQGDQPKQKLIETFRDEVPSVLFGTSSFWQGVDVEGEALSCVVIDKLPFASPADPLTAARIEDLSKKGVDPFLSFQIPAAVLSLRQGIGRLIRSRRDRGLIAILDRRITTKAYGKRFLSALPPAPQTDDFKNVVSFFKGIHRRKAEV